MWTHVLNGTRTAQSRARALLSGHGRIMEPNRGVSEPPKEIERSD